MADFSLMSGSKGVWLESVNIVVMQQGETADIKQWGLDGKGKYLNIVWKWSKESSNESATSASITRYASDHQIVSVTGERAGRDFYHAYLPGTSADFATILEVVVLPASQRDHLFLWSESVKKKDLTTFEDEASRASGTQIHIGTKQDLFDLLVWYKESRRTIRKLEFDAHGGPGKIFLRSKSFKSSDFADFKGKGLNSTFAPGARIFFHSCNTAEGQAGLDFLTDIGQTLLVGGGGSIGGSTSTGRGTSWIDSPVLHFTGQTIRVHIATDGSVERVERSDEVATAPFLGKPLGGRYR